MGVPVKWIGPEDHAVNGHPQADHEVDESEVEFITGTGLFEVGSSKEEPKPAPKVEAPKKAEPSS